MSGEARLPEWGHNVIPLAGARQRPAARGGAPALGASARERSLARLREHLPQPAILYAVLRWHNPENDWLIADFFRIDGHRVINLTNDVAHALGLFDPDRDVGLKLARPPGSDPLARLIDTRLSLALFGEANLVRHQVVA